MVGVYKQSIKDFVYLMTQKKGIEWVKLGDVCEINIGGTPSRSNLEYWGGTNKWVSVRELDGSVITDTREKITDKGVKKSSVKLIPTGTIMMSFKLSIGKLGIAGCDMYSNEAIASFYPNNKKLIDKYLYYSLMCTKYKGHGAIGIGNLNKSSLNDIVIPLPSLDQQKEIVKQCDFNQSQIESFEKQVKDNKDMISQIMKDLLGLSSDEAEDDIESKPDDEIEIEVDTDANVDPESNDESLIELVKPPKTKSTGKKKKESSSHSKVDKSD